MIKLDSMVEPAAPTQADLDAIKKQMISDQSQLFAQSIQQSLDKSYEKDGKVKINPIITQ